MNPGWGNSDRKVEPDRLPRSNLVVLVLASVVSQAQVRSPAQCRKGGRLLSLGLDLIISSRNRFSACSRFLMKAAQNPG